MTGPARHAFLLTTDFRPMPGGIATYLHGLWDHVGSRVPATVVTTVPPGAGWEHRYALRVLPDVGDGAASAAQRVFRMRGSGVEATLGYLREAGDGAEAFIGVWNVLGHFWCRALARAGVPYSLFAHDAELVAPDMYASVHGWRVADVAGARAVYAISTDTAARLVERFGVLDVRVLPPGVEEPADPEAVARRARELRLELGLAGKRVLLTVARLERGKGVDLVLECLGDLSRSYPGLHYVVAGDGAERRSLEEQARGLGVEGRVTFMGAVDEATKHALYHLCDVYVMPSRRVPGRPWEGFGISFLEAALSGKASVAGRVGGTADAVAEGVTGLLVDTSDSRGTFEALSRLLADEDLRLGMGGRGRERVRERFLWRSVADRFLRAARLVD